MNLYLNQLKLSIIYKWTTSSIRTVRQNFEHVDIKDAPLLSVFKLYQAIVASFSIQVQFMYLAISFGYGTTLFWVSFAGHSSAWSPGGKKILPQLSTCPLAGIPAAPHLML